MNKLNVILPNTEEEVYMKISVLVSNMSGLCFSNYFNICELYIQKDYIVITYLVQVYYKTEIEIPLYQEEEVRKKRK